jgi:hypothetical protein
MKQNADYFDHIQGTRRPLRDVVASGSGVGADFYFGFALASACSHGHGPRGLGTTSFRHGEFGASTPLYLNSGKRGTSVPISRERLDALKVRLGLAG